MNNRTAQKVLPYHPPQKEILDLFEDGHSLKLKSLDMIKTVVNQLKRQILHKYIDDECKLTMENYQDMLTMLVLIEDAFVALRVARCEIKNQKVVFVPNRKKNLNRGQRKASESLETYKCEVS